MEERERGSMLWKNLGPLFPPEQGIRLMEYTYMYHPVLYFVPISLLTLESASTIVILTPYLLTPHSISPHHSLCHPSHPHSSLPHPSQLPFTCENFYELLRTVRQATKEKDFHVSYMNVVARYFRDFAMIITQEGYIVEKQVLTGANGF